MRYIKLLLFFLGLCVFTNVWAQLSTNEKPVSFGREAELRVSRRSAKSSVIMPKLDNAKIARIEAARKKCPLLALFGYVHNVSLNLTNSGTWYNLSNGDKLWKLNVACPEAKAVYFTYDKFWLPEGGKLFVYSKDKKQTLGAFTSRNNKGDREHLRGFATDVIHGGDVVLEYYQPQEVTTEAIVSLNCIVRGYTPPGDDFGFNKSDTLMVNVNCDEGYYWKGEQRAVARILMKGCNDPETMLDTVAWYCSGSLVTTTAQQAEPYLLTAGHNLCKYMDANWEFYAYDNKLDDAIFYWNYEMPGCAKSAYEPPLYSTTGAIIVANNNYDTDFALLRLTEDPKELTNYIPYYLGWDNSGQHGGAGVCIHHPKGDVKKISTVDASIGVISTAYQDTILYDDADHWKVTWAVTNHGYGRTEVASSGSPLFNASHKIIGQLHGSIKSPDGTPQPLDWFSKFSKNWTGGMNSTNYRRLDCWLDSLGTNATIMEGFLYVSKTSMITGDEYIYGNIRITGTGQLTVQGDIEMGGSGTLTVESGGKLIIDGGTLTNAKLDFKPGSALRIINNGIIETRNGFKAPVGVKVDITHGKIL